MLRWAIPLALLLTANIAFADTLYQQTATTSELTGNSSGRTIYAIGTSTNPVLPAWTLESITMPMRGCTGFGCSGSSAYLVAQVYNGTAWIGVATSSTETIPSLSTPQNIVFDFTPFNIRTAFNNVSGAKARYLFPSQQNYWYRFLYTSTPLGLADSVSVYGVGLGTTTANYIWQRQDSQTISPAILFTGTDNTDITTRIDSLNTPANGATTASETVTFDWTIYFNDTTSTQDKVGIEIVNISSGASILPPPEQDIVASGYSTYDDVLTLNEGEEYLWRAYMRDTTGTQGYIYSGWSSFFVIYNPYPINLNVASSGVGSTTAGILPNYTSLYTYITTKPPFGFIFQTIAALENLNASSTPAFELESEENITENILSPVDIGMAWIIGLLFTMYMLRRLSHLEI